MSQIEYAGSPLRSAQECWWKVRVFDQAGAASPWSEPGRWTMGILSPSDWHGAQWIGATATTDDSGPGGRDASKAASTDSILLRRNFTVKPRLTRALAYVCGLGQYEMTVNGGKIGDAVLTPGWTEYTKTCLYDTYDITSALQTGENAVGLFLGNGFYHVHPGRYTKITDNYGPERAIGLIRLEYADGTSDTVITDQHWKVAAGPLTFSTIYGGEDYDARLVSDGWDRTGFDDSAWDRPVITNGPGGVLRGLSCAGPPVRVFDFLKPRGNKQLSPTSTVYDLGQNAALMVRFRVKGPAGSSIKVTPSELVAANGDIDDTMCGGNSYWTYVLSGKGDESYFSKFYYRGARYLRVDLGASPNGGLPVLESIEGDTVHADAPSVGQFSCSNPTYNSIYKIVRWAQMNNMMSVMTDCPTREKLGWLEEDHLNGPALRYNFDLSTLMTKMVNDMADSQRPDGIVPSTCPDFPNWPENMWVTPPEWGSACVAVPAQEYAFSGDVSVMRNYYGTLKRYVDYLSAHSTNQLVSFGLGDWYDNQKNGTSTLTPIGLTATAFYWYDAQTLSEFATLLGKTGDAAHYKELSDTILAAFTQKFFDAGTNNYATGSQASNAFPLAMGMVPSGNRDAVLANLVSDLRAKGSTAGEVSLKYVLEALGDSSRSDLIDSVYGSQTSGYGLQVKEGKTSLTEGWNGNASQDHFMFGQINEWFYRYLAGIQADPTEPAFKKIVIRPAIVPSVSSAKASYDSINGKIISDWHRDGKTLTLNVTIPPNTTATVYMPTSAPNTVKESARNPAASPGVTPAGMMAHAAVYKLTSGTYTFTSAL
jgi:hypothetical protein